MCWRCSRSSQEKACGGDAGEFNLELDSHSLQFAELCCFDSVKAQSLADAYTGHLFLLSNGSAAHLQQALKRGFTSVQQQDAKGSTEFNVEAPQGALSHNRLLGCLE